ncbi:MAG: BatD family protein [Bacteroidota bacterium]|nr:BatD family protein [Bacteroidota bacterium]
MYLNRKLAFLFCWMIAAPIQLALADDGVTFSAEAPRSVVMGQQFNLVYTSNNETRDLRIPEINNFEILMGPSTSTMSSTTIINGKYSSSVTYRFTYVLYPKKTGTFTISPATASIRGKVYRSNGLTIKVLPPDKGSSSSSSGYQSSSRTQQSSAASQHISSDQIFIRAIPSKTSLYEQEGMTVTYKLYTRVDITGFENPKFPEFKGFMAQEVQLPQNQQWNLENYNGANYRTAVLKQTVLFPRETGTLAINKGSFDVLLRIKVNNGSRRGSIFDDFFDEYADVKKTIFSNPVKINVRPLPFGKPKDFSGVAGILKMSSSITSTQVKANDAVTIKLTISGSGNLKMVPTPELTFPQDFEVYDPKVTNSFHNMAKGVSGTKTIDYLFIPRYAGTFQIPSTSLSYFDLSSGTYKTIKTPAYTLKVAKGSGNNQVVSGNFSDKEQLQLLGSDVRYLKTGFKVSKQAPLIYGQPWFWLLYVLLIIGSAAFIFINRKKAKANADVSRVRNRKANKVAVKRLKKASAYLKENNKESFYDELLKALWGYTSDKLNIPLSRLTKETVDSELTTFNVSEDIRNEYAEIVQTCEFARYAPVSSDHAMDDLYQKTIAVINKMENTIKK